MSVVIGLTGQSGAGKTLVSQVFEENGFGVINCDMAAREVTETGSECNRELADIFPECFSDDLTLDRRALGSIVFADRQKLDILNSVIFRYIDKLLDEKIAKYSIDYDYVLLDAPTLFEAGADKKCDIIVSVTADEDIRLRRITTRDGLDEASVKNRFASQHSQGFFEENSDFVIRNNGKSEDAVRQTIEIIDRIKED
ncbi:dephospho-CoA kinase [Ruminococcus albus]|uniref:Dephospho-CoA kinase n=1 Tax=Ruminococcus albus TaxID=1264 RepID=A0A1I1N8H1_RUMAL|nr:dephospho-CoA kinase [Ruminococcus albus]SFC94014.1 dephospho-CoA kinase [Ruminococcus albus]